MPEETNYEITVGEGDGATTINLSELGDDGKKIVSQYANDNWRNLVSEEYGTDASTTNFKSIDDLAKSYIYTKKALGSKVAMPNEESSEEEWNEFYLKLGRPETADGYELGVEEEYAKLLQDDKSKEQYAQSEKSFKDKMHKLGIPAKTANKLWLDSQKEYLTNASANQKAMKEAVDNEWKAWRNDVGNDSVDKQVKLAKSVAATFLDEDGLQWANNSGLLKNTRVMKFLAKIGESMSEDTLKVKPSPSHEKVGREAMAEADRMLKDKSHPMYDALNIKNHPDHDRALKEFQKLMEKGNK